MGAAVALAAVGFDATVVGPKVTQRVTLLAIGAGASGGLPTLYIDRLHCRAISNFALFEFDHPKGTLGIVMPAAEGSVVTFALRIM